MLYLPVMVNYEAIVVGKDNKWHVEIHDRDGGPVDSDTPLQNYVCKYRYTPSPSTLSEILNNLNKIEANKALFPNSECKKVQLSQSSYMHRSFSLLGLGVGAFDPGYVITCRDDSNCAFLQH